MPVSKALVSRRYFTAVRALCSAMAIDASWALSMRSKATRLPPESITATLSFQSRFFASFTAALITVRAWSRVMGAPYGMSNGILSGTLSIGLAAGVGACANAGAAARNGASNAAARMRFGDIWVLLSRSWGLLGITDR